MAARRYGRNTEMWRRMFQWLATSEPGKVLGYSHPKFMAMFKVIDSETVSITSTKREVAP